MTLGAPQPLRPKVASVAQAYAASRAASCRCLAASAARGSSALSR